TPNSEAVVAGEKLFSTLGCIQCHSANGGVSHKKGPDLMADLSQKAISREWLYAQLVNPKKHNLNTIMPSYNQLDDSQIKILIAFLENIAQKKTGPKEKMPPSNSPVDQDSQVDSSSDSKEGLGQAIHIVGNKDHGMTLFQQYCMSCHGPEGKINPSDASV